MDQTIDFFLTYGFPLTGIAVLGIIILGVLKYCNVFKKIAEKWRHYIYLGISVGISLIGAAVYLLIVKQFTAGYFFAIAAAILTLNQVWYNIFKITPVNELAAKGLDIIVNFFKKKLGIHAEETPEAEKTDEKPAETAQNGATTAGNADDAQQNE